MIDDILTFWFGDADPRHQGEYREAWFKVSADFDEQVFERFGATVDDAAKGKFDGWGETAAGSLALCILLDQFPRNLYRGSPGAFTNDAKALTIARRAVDAGQDQALSAVKRAFLYLPFEHSENLDDQAVSVDLFRALGNEVQYRYALEHYYVISRFGRFPTRNAALCRESTAEEAAFLESFSSF